MRVLIQSDGNILLVPDTQSDSFLLKRYAKKNPDVTGSKKSVRGLYVYLEEKSEEKAECECPKCQCKKETK